MKSNAIVRIVIWSLVILILASVLLTVLGSRAILSGNRTEYNGSDVTLNASQQVNIPQQEVRNLKIQWVAGSINIRPADVTEIQISEIAPSDPEYTMVCSQSADTLTIKFSKEKLLDFHFGITINDVISKDLTILVPRDWQCGKLEIEAASATLDVSNLTIGEVEFQGASGICEFTDCTVNSLELETASGDVTFTGSLMKLDCEAASADVTAILTNIPHDIDLSSMSGDLDITLPADAGFTLHMQAMSSDFASDFETTLRGDNYVSGDGACRMEVEVMSGDVSIHKGN